MFFINSWKVQLTCKKKSGLTRKKLKRKIKFPIKIISCSLFTIMWFLQNSYLRTGAKKIIFCQVPSIFVSCCAMSEICIISNYLLSFGHTQTDTQTERYKKPSYTIDTYLRRCHSYLGIWEVWYWRLGDLSYTTRAYAPVSNHFFEEKNLKIAKINKQNKTFFHKIYTFKPKIMSTMQTYHANSFWERICRFFKSYPPHETHNILSLIQWSAKVCLRNANSILPQ